MTMTTDEEDLFGSETTTVVSIRMRTKALDWLTQEGAKRQLSRSDTIRKMLSYAARTMKDEDYR